MPGVIAPPYYHVVRNYSGRHVMRCDRCGADFDTPGSAADHAPCVTLADLARGED